MAPKTTTPGDEATVSINVDELRNSKDQVLMRLMAIQSYIADLSKSYLEHANNVINGSSATIDIPAVPTLPNALDLVSRSPGARSEAGGKKRKRVHDPNAPKRALTPYFLYMQNNRSKIAGDLGSDVKPKDVSEEGTRRWQEMPAAQKEVWRQMYASNYEKYKVAMADYKAGKGGDEDHDPAASQLQNDIDAENLQDSDDQSSDDERDESDESSPSPAPPPKEKTPPPSSNKRRRSTGKNAKESSPAKQVSPQKKGKKNEPASAVKAEPTTKRRGGKKRKSEA